MCINTALLKSVEALHHSQLANGLAMGPISISSTPQGPMCSISSTPQGPMVHIGACVASVITYMDFSEHIRERGGDGRTMNERNILIHSKTCSNIELRGETCSITFSDNWLAFGSQLVIFTSDHLNICSLTLAPVLPRDLDKWQALWPAQGQRDCHQGEAQGGGTFRRVSLATGALL